MPLLPQAASKVSISGNIAALSSTYASSLGPKVEAKVEALSALGPVYRGSDAGGAGWLQQSIVLTGRCVGAGACWPMKGSHAIPVAQWLLSWVMGASVVSVCDWAGRSLLRTALLSHWHGRPVLGPGWP
jgi:hypothetical protein